MLLNARAKKKKKNLYYASVIQPFELRLIAWVLIIAVKVSRMRTGAHWNADKQHRLWMLLSFEDTKSMIVRSVFL